MMKQAKVWLIASMAVLSSPVWGHDAAEHAKKEAHAPDCAAMKTMDHSKMDMKDPLMQAMMQKCMAHMHADKKTAAEKPAAADARPAHDVHDHAGQ